MRMHSCIYITTYIDIRTPTSLGLFALVDEAELSKVLLALRTWRRRLSSNSSRFTIMGSSIAALVCYVLQSRMLHATCLRISRPPEQLIHRFRILVQAFLTIDLKGIWILSFIPTYLSPPPPLPFSLSRSVSATRHEDSCKPTLSKHSSFCLCIHLPACLLSACRFRGLGFRV